MPLVDRTERAQHWFTTGWPVMVAVVMLAMYAGIGWATLGRVALLETDLTLRNALLPAQITAGRVDKLEVAVIGLPQKLDSVLAHQVQDEAQISTTSQELAALRATVTALQASAAQHADHDFQRDLRAGGK